MKIAVCVSGAERLETTAFTNFMRMLPENAEIDCFGYFWEGGPLNDEQAVQQTLLEKAEGRCRQVEVTIGRDFVMDFDMVVQIYPETASRTENVLRMFRAIRRCNDMKVRREVEQGNRYDIVIRTRADLQISTTLDLGHFMPLARDFVVLPENGHWRGGLCDQFAFSSSENMDRYSALVDMLHEHCSSGCPYHPETLVRFHLQRTGLLPILAPISALLIRG